MGFLPAALTQANLDNQIQVVLNERRSRFDRPYGQINLQLSQMLFPASHPDAWPVIGFEEDIQQAKLEDVHHFYHQWYKPNNAILTLAGQFNTRQADVDS